MYALARGERNSSTSLRRRRPAPPFTLPRPTRAGARGTYAFASCGFVCTSFKELLKSVLSIRP